MKVAYYSRDLNVRSQTFILEQIRSLAIQCKHHDVELYLLTNEKNIIQLKTQDEFKDMDIFSLYVSHKKINVLLGIIYSFFKSPIFVIRNLRKFRRIFRKFSLIGLLKLDSFDIFHKQFASAVDEILFLKKVNLIKYNELYVSCRGYDVTRAIKKNPNIYRPYYSDVSKFLPVSASLADQLIGNGCPENKIIPHYSGLRMEKFSYQDIPRIFSDHELTVVSVGRIVEKKGFLYLIKAIELANQNSSKKIKLKIIGVGDQLEALSDYVKFHKLEHLIYFLGPMAHDKVINEIVKADILCMHCVTAKNGDMEGIPNVIKEAMALGTIVVSTDHSGIKELSPLLKYHLLSKEFDIEKMAENIISVSNMSHDLLTEIRLESRRYIEEKFASENLAKELLKLYQESCLGYFGGIA
jgi:colanic acid/amylovoran biosynthesis glycosyltransferase